MAETTHRQTDRHKSRKQVGTQVDRQAGTQAGRHTGTQIGRQTERKDMVTKNVDCLFKIQSG